MIRAGIGGVSSAAAPAMSMSVPMQVRDPLSYHASPDGGRVAFNITTGIVQLASGSAEQPLAALVNPTGSGRDVVIDLAEFGTSANATFRRYRGATLTGLTTTNAVSAANMGGGSAVSVARMYRGEHHTRTGGTVSKTAHIAAWQQYIARVQGRSILRPGQSLAWTIQQVTGAAYTASVYVEYYETPAAT